jgi:hypothetical protein
LCFGGVLDDPAEAEIRKFGGSLFEEDVGGLDVAMYDLVLEENKVSVEEMAHEGDGFVFGDALGSSEFVKIAFEISVLAILQDDVEVFSTAEAIVHFDDERRGDSLEGSYLAFDLLFDMVGKFVDVNDLDRNLHAVLALSVVDSPTGSLPQRLSLPNPII